MTAGRKKKVIIGILVALCMTVTGCAGSVKKGTKYLEEKDYKNAEVEFQDAVDKKKNLGEAYRGLGLCYWEQKKYEKAEKALEKALKNGTEETATLYNTNLFFSPEGELVAVHRKLKPTGAERVVWGDADKGYFPVAETPWGPMGSLICWESYMPLARVALYQKGITIYISPNTNDNQEWQSTIRHIAIEGHCYFINCDMYFTRDMYPDNICCRDEIERLDDIVCRGGSCIVDPYGHYVTQPVWDKEEIIYAELDMQKVPASRMEFDCCGHYSRNDVLSLSIDDK